MHVKIINISCFVQSSKIESKLLESKEMSTNESKKMDVDDNTIIKIA